MVQNSPAKKKLWGSKVDEIAFMLVITVHVYFVGMKLAIVNLLYSVR